MFRNKLRTVSCVLLALACGAMAARGEIVTYNLAGILVRMDDPGNLLPEQLEVGAPALASLRYDTSAPDLDPANPGSGRFMTPGWLMFDIGGLKFERTTWVHIQFRKNDDSTFFFSASATGEMTSWPTPFDPTDELLIQIVHFNAYLGLPSSGGDVLPNWIGAPSGSGSAVGVWQMGPQRGVEYALRLDMAPVPEPATWALLGLGIAGVCWRARRR